MKEQVHSKDKATAKPSSSQPSIKNLDSLAHQQTHPATLIQRAGLNPRSLTSNDVLQLQRLIGNQAVERQLAGTVQGQAAISTIQRYIEKGDAEKLFKKLEKFTTLGEKDKEAIKSKGGDGLIIQKALLKMLETLASLTLGKDEDTLKVAELPMELTLNWSGGHQLSIRLISPPDSGFHKRTFGVDRIVRFETEKKPTLYESRIDIAEQYQGGGAGAAIVRSGLEFATDLAIETITIEASDKGRYAWASIGFTPDPGEWDKIADALLKAIERSRPQAWDNQAAEKVIEPILKHIEPQSATLEENLRSAIKKGEKPQEFEFTGLDERAVTAVLGNLVPMFKPIGEKLDTEMEKNPALVFGQEEITELQMTNWGDFLSIDKIAAYLAKQALQQLSLEKAELFHKLQLVFAPVERLGGSILDISGGLNKKEVSLKGETLPVPARERLLEIVSPSTRSKYSLADVVDLANELKGSNSEAAAFIREIVTRSATWKGTADLTDKKTQERLKKSTGWK